MEHRELCRTVAERLQAVDCRPIETVVGFDGFVDHIIDVVDQRASPVAYTPVATITALAERIGAAAGHSTNLELVVRQSKIGGNGPIMAHALARQDLAVRYLGIVGAGEVHPAFAALAEAAEEMVCLGPPASTDALEFRDGKVMLGKLEPLAAVSVAGLDAAVGIAGLRRRFQSAGCIATVNWTMCLELTAIWEHLESAVLPGLRHDRPLWFVDLADPAKRPIEDLKAAIAVLGRLQAHADMILGLNEAEARQVLEAHGLAWHGDDNDQAAAERACRELQEHLGLAVVVCHMVRGAAAARAGESAETVGFFDPDPRITTGAGDHFNAGFLAALSRGLPLLDCVLLGTATSGWYVREASSPSRADLVHFLRNR